MTNSRSARALDGDEVVAVRAVTGARTARRDRAGDVVAIDLAEGQSLAEFVGAAIGIRRGGAAGRARGEAAVDAIAVAVIGNDEQPLLGLRGAGGGQHGRKDGKCDRTTHEIPTPGRGSAAKRHCNDAEECDDQVKAALTSRFRFNWRTNELAGLKVSNWAS